MLVWKIVQKNLNKAETKENSNKQKISGAAGQALEPVWIFNLPFMLTYKEGRLMTEHNDIIVMKTLNNGASIRLNEIR
jgi:hypothetical protein